MNRAPPDGNRLVEQGLVTAVAAANGVTVGVNRESASAGSAAWNFAGPKATLSGPMLPPILCAMFRRLKGDDRILRESVCAGNVWGGKRRCR